MTSRTVAAMAMDFTLSVAGEVDADGLDVVMKHIGADLRWADEVFSTHRDDSWISRISRGDAEVSEAPPAVAEVLDLCEQCRDETGGAFDARTPAGGVDPTGVVKTWAMERVAWRCALLGAPGWMLACAGDVMVAGRGPADGGWRVGIADPREDAVRASHVSDGRGRAVEVIELRTGRGHGRRTALATSGSAASGDIWDPRTGASAHHYAQVSVAGDSLVRCDAWATAIMAGGERVLTLAAKEGLAALALRVVDGAVRSRATPAWRTSPP